MDELDYMAGCHGHLSRLAAMCAELAPPTSYCPAFMGHPHMGLSHGFEEYGKDELGHGSDPRGGGLGGDSGAAGQHHPPLMLPAAPSVDPDLAFGGSPGEGKRHQTQRRPGARIGGSTPPNLVNPQTRTSGVPHGPEGEAGELTEESPEWQDFLKKRAEVTSRPPPPETPTGPPGYEQAIHRLRDISRDTMMGHADFDHTMKEIDQLEGVVGPAAAELTRAAVWKEWARQRAGKEPDPQKKWSDLSWITRDLQKRREAGAGEGGSAKVQRREKREAEEEGGRGANRSGGSARLSRQNQYADADARWRGPGQDVYYSLPSEHTDLSPGKARKILHDNSAQGHPLTEKQRGFFGAVAGHAHEHNARYSVDQYYSAPGGYQPEDYADHRIRMDDREWEDWKRRHPESVAPYAAEDPYPYAYAAHAGHTAECGQCGEKFYVHSNEANAVCPACGAASVSYRAPVPAPDDDDMVAGCRYMADTMNYCSYAVAPGFAPPPAEPTPAEYAAYGYYAAYAEMMPGMYANRPTGVQDQQAADMGSDLRWHNMGMGG